MRPLPPRVRPPAQPEHQSSPTIANNTLISGGAGYYTTGLWLRKTAATVSNNIIDGGTATGAGSESEGIFISLAGAPAITKNDINGGVADSYSTAIFHGTSSLAATVANNIIDGGLAPSTTGVQFYAGSPKYLNNTISGGAGRNIAYGVSLGTTMPTFENNLIFTSNPVEGRCINESIETPNIPAFLRNNDLFHCEEALYHIDNNTDFGYGIDLRTIGEVNTYLLANDDPEFPASGNVSVDPLFENEAGGDWHFQDTSPCAVTEGGLNLSEDFAVLGLAVVDLKDAPRSPLDAP